MGPGHASPPRRRAADERSRRLGRQPGLRVRLRGPHRRRVAPARGARRAHGGARVAPLRARPRRLRVAPQDGRRSRVARRRGRRRASAARRGVPPGAARASRAPALRRDAPARRCSTARSACSREPAARGTLELVAETVLALVRAGTPPHEIAVVCPSVDAVRLALETAFAALGVPVAFEGRAASRDDAVRPRAPVAAPLRLGRRRAARALRAPPLAVLGSRAQGGRLDRGPAPRARDRARRPRRRGRRRAPRGAATAAARSRASRGFSDRCRPRARRHDAAERARHVGAAHGDRARLDLRAHDAVDEDAGRARAARRRGPRCRPRGRALRARPRRRPRRSPPVRPDGSPCSIWLRARTRRFDAVVRPRARAGLVLPRRPRRRAVSRRGHPARARRATRCASRRGPTRRAATATSSRRPARGRGAGSCSSGRPRATRGHRASRARSGRRSASSSTRTTSGATRGDGRCRPLTWELEAAPTERERLRALAALAAADPVEAAALARENGWDRRLERATRAFDRPTRVTHERALRSAGAGRVLRLGARADGVLLGRVVRRAVSAPGDDRQADRPHAARLDRSMSRCSGSTRLPSAIPGAERVTEANVEAAVELMRECVAEAVETGLRIDADDLERRELEQGLQRDLEQLVRDEAASTVAVRPAAARGVVPVVRARARRRGQRQDRPRRRRSDERARDRRRLQVGRGSSAADIRDRRPAPAAALHARAARPARARADGRRLRPASAAGGGRAGCSARGRAGARVRRRDYLEPDDFDEAIEEARADRGRPRRADPQRRHPARPARRRVPALVRPLADVPEGAAVTTRPPNEQQRAAIEAHGDGLRRGRRGHGQDGRARRAVRPGRRRRRARRRLAARDHVHRAGRGRAARPDPRASARARAGPTSRSSSTAPGSRRSTASAGALLGALPARRRRRPARSACSTSRRRACSRARPSRRRSSVLRGRRARPLAAARDVRRRAVCARCSSRSTRRSARPGASSCSSPARARRSQERIAGCARLRERSRDDAGATELSSGAAAAALDLLEATPLPERLLALADLKARGPRAAAFDEARDALVAAALEELAARDRELLQELLTTFGDGVRGREGRASRRSTSRISSSGRATSSATTPAIRERERAAVPLDHGRRVPGHEPAPDRAARPPVRGHRTPISSSSATSSSRSTASGMPMSPCSASGGAPRRPCCR